MSMDADRYSRVRELFLAAEEMSPHDQVTFLRAETGDDQELYDEVNSLLGEHDPESARREGEEAKPVSFPSKQLLSRNSHGSSWTGSSPGRRSSASRKRERENKPKLADETPDQNQNGRRLQRSVRLADAEAPSSAILWAQQARRSRRRNNAWLWLAALLPTALIGFFTYRQVNATMEQSVRDELRGVADSLAHASRRFLVDKSRLVESWSRQPGIQSLIVELSEAERNGSADQLVPIEERTEQIQSLLQQLSGSDDVKFVVWSDTAQTLASSDDEIAKSGDKVSPEHEEMLSRVLSGETVVFGPERVNGSSDPDAYPEPPVMAIVVPVKDDNGEMVGALMVRGIGMFDEFSRMYFDTANAGNLDAYAVNQDGVMVTESPRATTLASMRKLDSAVEDIAASLRVADPGEALTGDNIPDVKRARLPLTASAASATNGSSRVQIDPYRNYAGQEVVGAWRWNADSRMGIIVERQADKAYATVRIVRSGFLLLGTLLFITASVAAAFLARATTAERAAIHPLNRYEVRKELGSGGMGVVYLARHRQLGRDTALKVMIGGRRSREDQLRFDREARLAASLSNPHSVMIYDYGQSEDGESYCVMEFLRGLTLHEVVARSGAQPIGRVLFIVSQICEALTEAHGMNLLHRDIKPQNIMLSLDQSVGDWAVLFDYGLAKPLEPVADASLSSEAHWSGTPMYMAPERFRQPNSMDPRSDIYSLGCVAYFLLTGHPPFAERDADSLFTMILSELPVELSTQRGDDVPDVVASLVTRCMEKSARDRFETIDQFAAEIDQLRSRYPWTVTEARSWWGKYGDDEPG